MNLMAAAEKDLRRWRERPVEQVRECFKAEPDDFQVKVLEAFANPAKQRIAMKASKGPGKTTALAWCAWNFLSTRLHPRIAATSISGDNLRDNLWPEMAKWQQRSPFLQTAFAWAQTRIVARQHPETWWMSARQWSHNADPQRQADTLAGLHADYIASFLDEVGGIPSAVLATAEASLATCKEGKIVMAGNPTMLEGPLYAASTTERHLWELIEINGDPDSPTRSSRISLQWAREQIEKYGRDNPWVLVNVFGQFPPASLNALLGPDQVGAAMGKHLTEDVYSHAAKVLGVDPGREGGARTVIFPRQGLAAFAPVVMRPDRMTRDWTGVVAGRIAQAVDKWHADAVFVDDTGGWGAGIIDSLIASGYPVIPVNFGAKAMDPRYKNRRAEMYFAAAEWVKAGGALPFLPELQREATVSKYWFRNGVFQIEEKEQVKELLNGESPDLWDAFVLTHAQPVAPRTGLPWIDNKAGHALTEYPDEVNA
jgi:hypothetical protein